VKKIIYTIVLMFLVCSQSWAVNRYIQSDKASVNFGSVSYNSLHTQDIVLTNPGGDTQTEVTNIYFINYPSSFTVVLNDAPPTRIVTPSALGGSLTVRIQSFFYQDIGTFSDTLVIENNSQNAPVLKIPVTVTIYPTTEPYTWNKSSIDFGDVRSDIEEYRDTVTFSTTSFMGLDILEIYLAREETDFSVFLTQAPPTCTLQFGIDVKIGIKYSPVWEGEFFDTLIVKTSSTPTYVYIPLRANVIPVGASISVSKTELDFGMNGYGETYKDQTFNVRNTDEVKTVTFSGYNFNPADSLFYVLETFPFTLNPQEIKSLTVRFFPNRTGYITNTLRLQNNSGNNPDAGVNLYAQVTGSSISTAPSAIDFGTVGLNSAPRDTFFTITNSGPYKLRISSLSEFVADSIFRLISKATPTSPIILNPNQTYKVNVRLNPYQFGLKKDSINVINNSESSPSKKITLAANIVNPSLSISPSVIDFGTTSQEKPFKDTTISIKNDGAISITLSSNEILNDTVSFKLKSNLGNVTIAPGRTETLIVEFYPRTLGSKNGILKITSNDPLGNIRQISLSGVGGGKPVIAADKQSINFGDIVAGSTKDTTITLRNDGNINLNITSKSFTGNNNSMFSFVSGGTAIELSKDQTEIVRIRINGTLPSGSKSAGLSIISNDPDKPNYNIELSANIMAPVISRTPDRVTFDTLAVGNYKDTVIQINNTGNSLLNITGIYFDGGFETDFSVENISFPFSIQPGGQFNLKIRFRPLSAGMRFARAVIQSNDPANPEVFVILIGNSKVADQPAIYLAFSALNFGKVFINSIKDSTFSISNSGTQKLIVDSLKLMGLDKAYYQLSGFSLPIQLNPGQSQSVGLQFFPTLSDTNKIYYADIRIKSNDPNNPVLLVPVTGSGKAENLTGGTITHSPTTINFGQVTLYQFKDTIITLTNTSPVSKTIDSLNITGTDKTYFSLQTAFPITINPNSSKTITVRFSPTSTDLQKTYTSILRIRTSDTQTPLIQITLSGKGLQGASAFFVSPLQIDFGKINLNSRQDNLVKIKNTGLSSLTINSISFEGVDTAHFKLSEPVTLPIVLGSLEEKIIKLYFLPKSLGSKQVSLKITSTDLVLPSATVLLRGEGDYPTIDLVSAINFGNVMASTAKDTIIVVKNSSAGILEITNLSITGQDINSFTIKPVTNISKIQPSETDTIYIRFNPANRGTKSAALNITVNDMTAANSIVNLSGTGIAPQISVIPSVINFGKISFGINKDSAFTILNNGNAVLNINNITLDGVNKQYFSLSGFSVPLNLNPASSRLITVRYIGSIAGIKNANILISSDDPDAAVKSIALTAETEPTATIINQTQDFFADFGQDKQISFALSHSIATNYVQVFYRLGGGTKFDSANATITSTGYTYTFSKNILSTRGLDYYIKVTTPNGIITFPETNYLLEPLHIRIKIPALNVPEPLKASTYSMLSIPFDFGTSNFQDEIVKIFGNFDPFVWRIFHWSNGDYLELTSANPLPLKAGDGFWAIYSQDFSLNFSNVVSTSTNEPYKITLQPGWNQIGNPFLFNVALNELVIPSGKNVENILWKWASTKYEEETSSINPFTGYFIMNNETSPVDILVNPVYMPAVSGKKSVSVDNESGWKINLTLLDEKGNNDKVKIGLKKLDNPSYSKPPLSPGRSIDIRIIEGNREFAGLFKELKESGASWLVRLNNLSKNKKYSLFFEISGSLPKEMDLVFLDEETGNKIYPVNGTYSFISSGNSKQFKVIAGEKSFTENELINNRITEFRLSQNYPNPFNPSTKIEYTLREAAYVTLKVYNQLGQELAEVVNDFQNKGSHSVTWFAEKAPSGIYYYKLSAGSFSAMKKMMLIK